MVYLDTSRPHTTLSTPSGERDRREEGVSPPGRIDSPIQQEEEEDVDDQTDQPPEVDLTHED